MGTIVRRAATEQPGHCEEQQRRHATLRLPPAHLQSSSPALAVLAGAVPSSVEEGTRLVVGRARGEWALARAVHPSQMEELQPQPEPSADLALTEDTDGYPDGWVVPTALPQLTNFVRCASRACSCLCPAPRLRLSRC